MILCILIGAALSRVVYSFIKLFFKIFLQNVDQDIMQGGDGAMFTCGELGYDFQYIRGKVIK